MLFKIINPDSIPEAISQITASGLMEDILIFAMKDKKSNIPMTLLQLFIVADTEKEMQFKQKFFSQMFDNYKVQSIQIPPPPV